MTRLKLRIVKDEPAAEPKGPSTSFLAITRNPLLAEAAVRKPWKFEPTPKRPGEIVI